MIRPRVQIPVLVVIFTVWGLIGVSMLTVGDVIGGRDWSGLAVAVMSLAIWVAGVWRALRLGVVISADGVRIRGFDSRDEVIDRAAITSIDVHPIDERAGMPLFGPVVSLVNGTAVPIPALGTYSLSDAESRAAQLRAVTGVAAA